MRFLLRAGFLLWPLFVLRVALAEVPVSGVVALELVKGRRAALRYGGDGMAELGPPAPFVAVVYLTAADGQPLVPTSEPAAPVEAAIMEQRGLQFYPAVLPIRAGSRVNFPNLDNTYHNVFSYSDAHSFDLGRYTKEEEAPTVRFEKAGVVRVFCEVHAHMRAVILVLDTPFFCATDAEGRFEIPAVPPGDYQLNIWRINEDLETRPLQVADQPVHLK